MTDNPTMERLEDQIGWYDKRSSSNQQFYKALKITVIVLAAAIPLLSGINLPFPSSSGIQSGIIGLLGAVIVVVEGLQQLNQYQANWISYRSTCEALKHEKYLYLGHAGPYATASDPQALLAERIESFVSQEHAKWASAQENIQKGKERPNEP